MLNEIVTIAGKFGMLIDVIGPANVATAIIALNFATFAAFGIDKSRAENGQWRIQESTLLGMTLLGGTVGAWSGRRAFRHKTRKQPFNSELTAITVLQIVLIGLYLGWQLGG